MTGISGNTTNDEILTPFLNQRTMHIAMNDISGYGSNNNGGGGIDSNAMMETDSPVTVAMTSDSPGILRFTAKLHESKTHAYAHYPTVANNVADVKKRAEAKSRMAQTSPKIFTSTTSGFTIEQKDSGRHKSTSIQKVHTLPSTQNQRLSGISDLSPIPCLQTVTRNLNAVNIAAPKMTISSLPDTSHASFLSSDKATKSSEFAKSNSYAHISGETRSTCIRNEISNRNARPKPKKNVKAPLKSNSCSYSSSSSNDPNKYSLNSGAVESRASLMDETSRKAHIQEILLLAAGVSSNDNISDEYDSSASNVHNSGTNSYGEHDNPHIGMGAAVVDMHLRACDSADTIPNHSNEADKYLHASPSSKIMATNVVDDTQLHQFETQSAIEIDELAGRGKELVDSLRRVREISLESLNQDWRG